MSKVMVIVRFRISRDREDRHRAETKQRDKDAEDGCETRTIDKEMGQAHGADSALALAVAGVVTDDTVLWRDF